MLQAKAEQRIDLYLQELRVRRFASTDVVMQWKSVTVPERSARPDQGWEEISFPFLFGKAHHDTWFVASCLVPEDGSPFLAFDVETDAMLFIDGNPEAAVNPFHREVCLDAWRGRKVEIAVCAWDGYPFPGYHPYANSGSRILTTVSARKKSYPLLCKQPQIVMKQEASYALYYDVWALRGVSQTLDPSSLEYQQIVSHLHEALLHLEMVDEDPVHREKRAGEVRAMIAPLFKLHNGSLAPKILSEGSAHIDHAWLWVKEETVRKAARTMCSMTMYCKMYPQFRFLLSQPIQTWEVKQHYPSVYAKVREAYERGQWEPNGIGLVEPDCVMSSGEGLIRNLLMGAALTEELFPGYQGDTFFVPDSFGFSGNLPQILKGCGVSYFVTSKLGWNDTNRFPYDTFIWEGIDGSTIKAHMVQGAYEGTNDPVQIASMWKKIQHKDVQTCLYRTVGEGDGGGGTMLDDLELEKRLHDIQGFPNVRWTTLSQAMKQVFRTSHTVPVYHGELYFELHRGTYTTQGKVKEWNRRLESALHNVEYLLSHAYAWRAVDDQTVPALYRRINDAWKTVLVNQFHDILPGTGIEAVYDEARAEYQAAYQDLASIQADLVKDGSFFCNLNPCTVHGIAPYTTGVVKASPVGIRKGNRITVPWGSVTIGEDGTLSHVVYHGRDLVRGPEGWNSLRFGEDYAIAWEGCDIEKDLVEQMRPLSVPMTALVREGKIGAHSHIRQEMVVHTEVARIDFETTIDWCEDHRLLQAVFPIAVDANEAVYDIPFGWVKRSTRENTSFEKAMFEVPGRQFVMVGDQDVSCALVTDSKYGYHAKGGEIGVSLLRSPKAPDPQADMGVHQFRYAMVITADGLLDVMAQAAEFNNPLLPFLAPLEPLVSVAGSSHLWVDTVKPAEDGNGIIFRIREVAGTPAKGKLSFASCLDPESLEETDMRERTIRRQRGSFRPFEIRTYRILRRPAISPSWRTSSGS